MSEVRTPAGPVLAVRDLRVVRPDGAALVDGVSWQVSARQSLGLVGESGSGKSLTLRAAAGILPATLRRDGQVDRGAGRLAMVFQEPALALNPTMRIGSLVAAAWARHHPGDGVASSRAAAVELLSSVGIDRARNRFRAWPHELSGGMRQRVVIAAALATEPQVLLCDEPTTALDVRVQAQILDLLRTEVADRDMALVFVSHDLAVVASVCERLVVMRHGVVVETGDTRAVLAAPAHPYTRELLAANLSRRLAATGRAVPA